MADINELKKIISDNQNDIAFIIGNGIHNFLRHKEQNYDCMAWSELLEYLWRTFAKNKPFPSFMNCQYSNGITNTEFFNLLEIELLLNCKSEKRVFSPLHLSPYTKEYKNSLSGFSVDKIIKIAENISTKLPDKTQYRYISKSFQDNHNTLKSIAERDFGLKNEHTFDIINQVVRAITDKHILFELSEPIKKKITLKMREYKPVERVKQIVNYIQKINAPILTTNYDTVLSKAIDINDNDILSLENDKINNWSSYYGEQLESPLSGFGIWHIHGFHTYHKSISIGATDYMKNVQTALNLLPQNSTIANLNEKDWIGYNTWLSIIFNKSLFMFGLKLDNDETFIRWLLIIRYKYMINSGNLKKAWYIINDSETMPCAKRYFLESVGFEIVKISNWDILYEKLWN